MFLTLFWGFGVEKTSFFAQEIELVELTSYLTKFVTIKSYQVMV